MIGRRPLSREGLEHHLARSLEQRRAAGRAFCSPPKMKRPTSLSLRAILIAAVLLYGVGVWLHIPYGGGHVYSDIVTVFQNRECHVTCTLPVPYVQGFVEYPVLTAFFMYAMGALGEHLPGALLTNYYTLTWIALLAPTLLLVRELYLLARMRGVKVGRVLWFYVATPTFLIMILLNWYVIGTFFAVAGIRQFLLGKKKAAGALMGLSAASNLVTAAPAVGLMLSERRFNDAFRLAGAAGAVYGAINVPVFLLNPSNWLAFWTYQTNWYAEGSWMLMFIDDSSPLRHVISMFAFVVLFSLVLVVRFRFKERDPVRLAFLATFVFVFSSYVYTPQMSVMLLPFFVILLMPSYYVEFLAFDLLNAGVIVVGFSQVLLPLGITYSVAQFGFYSPNQWMAIIRSFWLGKFLVYDGLLKPYFAVGRTQTSLYDWISEPLHVA